MDDDDIRALVARLARPHKSGGAVVARAAILAEGADFDEVMTWITDHDGAPEDRIAAPERGLHAPRLSLKAQGDGTTPTRFVLPPGALD